MQLTAILLILTFSVVNSQVHILGTANNLPMAVRLGGAIVAAVEEDAEQEEYLLARKVEAENKALVDNLAKLLNVNYTTDSLLGRGKYHKQKKLMKYIYPLVMGILLAKTVLIPVMLKLLTAISTSSFVMSKISLAATALLFLKYIIGGKTAEEVKERVEIIHVPVVKDASGSETGAWEDNTWSNSLYERKPYKYRQNYIPVVGTKDVSYTTPTNFFHYPQHNYNKASQYGRPYH